MPYPTSPPHHSNGQPQQGHRYEYRQQSEVAPGQGQPYQDWRDEGSQPHRYPPPGDWRPPSSAGQGQQGEERFQLAPLYQSAYRQPQGYYHPHGHAHSRSSSAISQPYRDDMRPSSSHSQQQMVIHKTEAPSPAKPLTEDEGPPGLRPKKKRRLALSCAQCAKRKQKCNRETPCQHCVARKVPELCVPYSRGPTPPPSANPPPPAPTMSARMNKVETLLNAMVELVPGIEKRSEMTLWRSLHPPTSANANTNEEMDQDRRRSTSTPSRRSVSDDAVPAQPTPVAAMEPEDVEAEKVFLGGLDLNSGSRNPLPESLKPPTQRVELTLDSHGTPDENLRRLFNECGVHPYRVTEIIQDLPPKQFADRLIAWFFSKVNFVRYPIDERLFRNSYEDVYRKAHSMDSTMVLALPLIFIVLAIAVRLAPPDWAGPDQTRKASSLRLYWTTRLAITISVSIKSESLQLVEARLLSAMYLVLIHERRLAEGWTEIGTAIRVAQALGLHRDGTKLGLGVFETEYRRRIWSYLLHADRTYSCLLGRPSSIDDACCDTLPPTNIEISMLEKNVAVPARPLTEPTFATYLLLRQGLAKILGKMVFHFQRLDVSAQYRDVELIDGELRDFVRNLPPHFSMRNPDKSLDSALWYLPVHRYYIQTEILHFSIILHRPWLLRKLRNNRYSLSRNTCFESAVTDFKIRRAFKVECPNFIETLVGGSFREFNVAMIAGISVIIDPRGPLSKDMRMILQSFLEQHPVDQSLDLDDFSQKEASIIYTLNRRGQEMAEAKRSPQGIPLSRHPWHTSTSFERGSAASTKAGPMQPPRGGQAGSPASGSSSTPVQEKSFLSPVDTPNGNMGPPMQISPNAIPSPEDDMPQRLFDYWLTNTAVPGSQSHVAGQAPIPSQSNIGVRSHSGLTPVMPGLGNGSLQYIVPQPVQGSDMPIWTEPPSASFIPPGVPPPANVQNSSEFWNSLIDGIVGTMPGGESLLHENV